MPRVRELRDLVIDEISLVDKGANQHATVTIAKRRGEEEQDMTYYDGDGNPVDTTSLEIGDVVYDEQGSEYEFVPADEVEDDDEDEDEPVAEVERELELVGKAFRRPERAPVTKSLAEQVRVELSKALTDADRDEVIAKALGAIDDLALVAKRAEANAEAERQLRLEREYTEIAKAYNVPVAPEVLGGVLMRLAETMDIEDQKVIAKCLDAASSEIFEEIGKRGGGDNADIFSQVEAMVAQTVSKTNMSREEAVTEIFGANPEAYDEYLANQRQGR